MVYMVHMALQIDKKTLKKTTVYLSDNDLLLLRKMANIRDITVAEAIRVSINDACKPKTKHEKTVWDALDKIWAKTEGIDSKKIEAAVDRALVEVRGGKKNPRRP